MRFRQRVLEGLDTIYGFLGQQHSTDELQLAQGVTLVHDVSREAEGRSAVWRNGATIAQLTLDVIAAGAGTNYASFPISVANLNQASTPYDYTRYGWRLIYCMGVELASTPQCTAGRVYIAPGGQAFGPNEAPYLVWAHSGTRERFTATSAMTYRATDLHQGIYNPGITINETCTVYAVEVAAAAGTVRHCLGFEQFIR